MKSLSTALLQEKGLTGLTIALIFVTFVLLVLGSIPIREAGAQPSPARTDATSSGTKQMPDGSHGISPSRQLLRNVTGALAVANPRSLNVPEAGPLGADCSSPVVFDDHWADGFRLVCQNNMYVLMVDLTNPAIKVEVVAASSGTRSVSSYADSNTIAILNADYQWCSSGSICSQGLTISNGSDPASYTNISHLCSDARVRRVIGLSQDGRVTVDWWYRFVSDSQARAWCGSIPGQGGGLEEYRYNVVGGGPQFTFDGTFHWDCQYGQDPVTHNCYDSGGDVGINGEHFSVGDWWNRYQSAVGYSTDGTVLALAESNNRTHTMQETHDIMYQRLSAYGKTLKNAFKFDGGSKAGFWYYISSYSSTPGVTVPNVIRVQRTNSTCYSLQTNISPGGTGSVTVNTPSNCAQGKYLPGTSVQLTANANSGYTFANWSGDASGSSNPTTIAMSGNKNVTANFSAIPTCYSLTRNVSPAGSGSITVTPGPNCNGTQYSSGTLVQLTANANSGYTFANWSGDASGSSNPTTITMNGNKNVTANFSAIPTCYSLTRNVSPVGSGSITVTPGPNCNGTQYSSGTVVQLTAHANSGYTFANWSGDAGGSNNPTTITMSGNKSVTANFGAVCPTIVDWKGEYWNNMDLTGSPALCRNDFSLAFDWGYGPPDPSLSVDGFSSRWTRTLNFPAGAYRFHMFHDDGGRLYIDDVQRIDAWGTCCTWETADVTLTNSNHTIRMEMFENGGVAVAALWWERLDISGWRGEYYNNEGLSEHPILVRDDGDEINFDWLDQSPDPLVQSDHFSARWTRSIDFAAATYRFDIFHDDGVRFYIDNGLVFENWCDNCRLTESVNVPLSAGTHDLKLEMYENGGWAGVRLSFSVDGCSMPGTPLPSTPANASITEDHTPTFGWNTSADSNEYQLQVDDNSEFASPEIDETVDSPIYTSASWLTDGTYYWRVRGHNTNNACDVYGPWSEVWTVIIHTPFDITANWTTSAPVIDGQISAHEWDGAAAYDITMATSRSQRQNRLVVKTPPDVFLQEQGREAATPQNPQSTVALYVMNDGTHLYLAMDNPNDSIQHPYDQMGVYFDDNPLPSDGRWTNTSCGNSDGEGNFWVLTSTVKYREWISGPGTCPVVFPALGTLGTIGYDSGHVQGEISIELSSSALRAAPGSAINMYLWIYDADLLVYDGWWPITADYTDPSTYRLLTLSSCSTPTRPSLSSPPNGSSICDTTPAFGWMSVSGASSYRIQVDNNMNFGSPEVNTVVSSLSYTPHFELLPAIYYWRVQATSPCGNSAWSPIWGFTIQPDYSIYLPVVLRGRR